MGRLDSAMRRSAEEHARDKESMNADLELMDVRDLETDVFPSETDDLGAVENLPPVTLEMAPERPAAELTAAELEVVEVDPPAIAPVPVPEASVPVSEGRMLSGLKDHVSLEFETKTVVDDTMLPASREQYRRLAAALHQAQRANGFKVAIVASAVAGEGKSLTAANLALTLSESYRRNVLIVDADLRRPTQHTIFQVSGAPGLSEGLVSIDEPKLPLHRLSSRLSILPAGMPTSDPIGAITSERMRRLIEEAREVFDWVIIDTPPVGLLSDAALLSSMADGVVLVVKAQATPHDLVQRAVEALGRDRVLGMVLNRAVEQKSRSSYDYYKYYAPSQKALGQ